MNKLVVEVYLPAAQQKYDVRLPANAPLSTLTQLVGQVVSQASEGVYIADEGSVLLDRERGTIFDINMTPRELGLKNGSRLMLI